MEKVECKDWIIGWGMEELEGIVSCLQKIFGVVFEEGVIQLELQCSLEYLVKIKRMKSKL